MLFGERGKGCDDPQIDTCLYIRHDFMSRRLRTDFRYSNNQTILILIRGLFHSLENSKQTKSLQSRDRFGDFQDRYNIPFVIVNITSPITPAVSGAGLITNHEPLSPPALLSRKIGSNQAHLSECYRFLLHVAIFSVRQWSGHALSPSAPKTSNISHFRPLWPKARGTKVLTAVR